MARSRFLVIAALLAVCAARPAAAQTPLRYSTYVGTFSANAGRVAIGPDGGVYVAYRDQVASSFGSVVRVLKFNAARQLVWSNWVLGQGNTEPVAIAVAPDGGVWIAGNTTDRGMEMVAPWRPGDDPYSAGSAFLVRFSREGSLTLSTLLAPGSMFSAAGDVVADPDGSAVVSGQICGPGMGTAPNVIQFLYAGSCDAFVARVGSLGKLSAATYIGGTGAEYPPTLALGPDGDIYVAGPTDSRDLATSSGAFQQTPGRADCSGNPCGDGYVLRMSRDMNVKRYLTYVRETDPGNTLPSAFDTPTAIAVGPTGDAYVAGSTASNNLFPTTPGAYRTVCPFCHTDGFLLRLNAQGTALVYSTFLDATPMVQLWRAGAVVVDAAGHALVGVKYFSGTGEHRGSTVQRFDPAGTAVQYTASLPEMDLEDMTPGSNGTMWIGGTTTSFFMPVTSDAYDKTRADGVDAFLAAVGVPEARVTIDVPGATAQQTFDIGGWAIDAGSDLNAGIDAIHVYAYPNPGSGQAPVFLGASGVTRVRPDIAGLFGPQFSTSGWDLHVSGLSPGSYMLAAFAHSSLSSAFDGVATRTVTIVAPVSQPLLAIDVPSPNATASSPLFIAGWAIDRAAATGTGVDTVHVWAYPNPGSGAPPVFLGVPAYGIMRSDIGGIFGARFGASGYELSPSLAPGTYLIAVSAHSTVTNSFVVVQTRMVTVR